MGQVINLQEAKLEREPHSAGVARCLSCKYEWAAVVPLGVLWLECPACTLVRGRCVYQHERPEDHYHCNCGNDLFYITEAGAYCPNCGQWHEGVVET